MKHKAEQHRADFSILDLAVLQRLCDSELGDVLVFKKILSKNDEIHSKNIRQRGREPVREGAHDRAEAPSGGFWRTASWALSSLA